MKLIYRSFLLWLVLSAASGTASAGGGFMPADRASRLAEAGELTVIDVRSPDEWRKTGIARHGKPVSIHDRDGAAGFLRGIMKAVGSDKTRPIALICAAGNRSTRAHAFLTAQGFENVYNVREGMFGSGGLPGWIRRGLPLEPCPVC